MKLRLVVGAILVSLAGDVHGQAPEQRSPLRVSITVNSSVITQHKSGVYSVFGVSAVNASDEEGEALVAIFHADDPSRQYARRIWVPADSRRQTWLPVAIPPNLPSDVTRQSYTWITLDPAAERETFHRHKGDQLTNSQLIAITHDPVRTATMFSRPQAGRDFGPQNQDREARETLMAARKSADMPEQANDMFGDFLPPWSQVLQGLDQFLLTTDRIVDDQAGLVALRNWVRDGGRLWITLDLVNPSTVSALLGSAVNFEVVDRVELDRYELTSLDVSGQLSVKETCEYDDPVTLVRIMTTGTDVPCRIDGWPAALWIPMGEGEILVTTLGARGWRPDAERKSTAALRTLATRLFAGRDGKVSPQQFRASLQQRIGYQVPRRSFGGAVLGSYCVALLVGGAWLFRRGQAERLVWLVPIATLVAGGVLAGAGAANSTSVPPSIAVEQLVSVMPETDEAFVQGLAATYDHDSRPVEWKGQERGWTIPDVPDGAEVRRQLWTDDDGTETQNATTRASSIGLTQLDEQRVLPRHVAVTAHFGPEGLEGRLFDSNGAADPVIVAPAAPSLGVVLRPDGRFVSGPGDVLAAEQFSSESLLTDQQRQRQNLLRNLFNPADTIVFPHRPTLVFWRGELETSAKFPEGFRVDGESLVMIPLELRPTPPGTAFRIPATFLRPTSTTGGQGVSIAFNSKTGLWLTKLNSISDTTLQFQLPPQVMPCDMTRGKFTIRINAPSRELGIWAYRDNQRENVRTIKDANGAIEIDLSADQLQLDERGRVRIAVTVGPTAEQQDAAASAASTGGSSGSQFSSSTWQIDYVRLTVDGQTRQESSPP